MAGKRMTPTEIWLRLINIGSLYGDAMLDVAQKLHHQTTVDARVVETPGFQRSTSGSSSHSVSMNLSTA